jgi:hypothetical protein
LNVIVNPITQNQGVLAKTFHSLMTQSCGDASRTQTQYAIDFHQSVHVVQNPGALRAVRQTLELLKVSIVFGTLKTSVIVLTNGFGVQQLHDKFGFRRPRPAQRPRGNFNINEKLMIMVEKAIDERRNIAQM